MLSIHIVVWIQPLHGKKLRFIFPKSLTSIWPITCQYIASRILMSFFVDETLLRRKMNLSTNSRKLSFRVEMSHILDFVCIHIVTYAAYCPFQTMQHGFSLGGCICQKCYVISVVRVRTCACRISFAFCLFVMALKGSQREHNTSVIV